MPDTVVGSALSDGSGVSTLTSSKLLKDLVADFLLTASAALVAVNVVSIDAAAAQPTIVATAVGGALIRVLYRAVLKWATS